MAVITFICSSCIKFGEDNADIIKWNMYTNEENHFFFEYPKDWEVIDNGLYKTHYGLTIQRIGKCDDSDDWIRINSPQFTVKDGKCITINDQHICTYSNDASVLDIFDKIAASFTVERD
ncbi:MAG TPA: hypothetical protein ENN79_12100 [Desulfobacteraceae bacterium]|nr:hypothetical protein [Desulfobacteraceae bacterium]